MEVFSAAVASAQIVGYILQIAEALFELHDHIKHAPTRFESYIEQLESLSITIRYFQDNQDLLTVVAEAPLEAISQRVDVLNQLLRKTLSKASQPVRKRLARVFFEKQIEKRIKEGFVALERDKINLVMCLAGSNRKALEDFRVALFLQMAKVDEDGKNSTYDLIDNPNDLKKQIIPYTDTFDSNADDADKHTAIPNVVPVSSNVEETERETKASEPTALVQRSRFVEIEVVGIENKTSALGGVGFGAPAGDFEKIKVKGHNIGMVGPMGADIIEALGKWNLEKPESSQA